MHTIIEKGFETGVGPIGHAQIAVIPLHLTLLVAVRPIEDIKRIPEVVRVFGTDLKFNEGGFVLLQPLDHQIHGLGFVEDHGALIQRGEVRVVGHPIAVHVPIEDVLDAVPVGIWADGHFWAFQAVKDPIVQGADLEGI